MTSRFFLRTCAMALVALPMIGTVHAGKGKFNSAAAEKKKAEDEAKRKERAKKHEALQKVLDAKDANHDGSLTKDEYLTGEADAAAAGAKFDSHNKNKDRYLSKAELTDLLGL